MKKLPIKQIYLLVVVIVGIIAISVYSTYALFTFENSTSNIVTIHTPNSLSVLTENYEYNQIDIEKNSTITTDVDVYNSFDYELCYTIWYKIIGSNIDLNKVEIYQKTNETLNTSGIIHNMESKRITLIIINDNDEPIRVNIGLSSSKFENTCSLNIAQDFQTIKNTYNYNDKLNNIVMKSPLKTEDTNYLNYKNITNSINYSETDIITIGKSFTYKDELFSLTETKEIAAKELSNYQNYYLCQNNCQILYKITDTKIETNNDINIYKIIKYDKLVGYYGGESGIKKIANGDFFDYVYYGDNPNNFIYYNCKDNNDLQTCELWRILGIYYDKNTKEYNAKIIKNDSLIKSKFDYKINAINENVSSNIWSDPTNDENNSTLFTYLNEKYEFVNNYDHYILSHSFNIQKLDNLDILSSSLNDKLQAISSKVGLLNISDYLVNDTCKEQKISEYAEECLNKNWISNQEIPSEWTLSILDNENNDSVYTSGTTIKENNVNELMDIRPVIYLKSRMLLVSGDGSITNPYFIK